MLTLILAISASMYIKNPADTTLPGFRIIEAEGKTVRMIPTTEYTAPGEEDHYRRLHHHGVALESKQMAYRLYFDRKQTVDVYCKRRPQMELATSYWYPSDEQIAHHYGNDILRVSGTIGVGTLKPYSVSKHKMVHFDQVVRREQRIVEQGRKRGVMEMTDYGWQNGSQYVDTLRTRYTMENGARDMMVEGYASEPVSGLCTGVQLIPLKTPVSRCQYIAEQTADGGVILASWGTDWPQNDSAKYAKETVGLAVYIPAEYVSTLNGQAEMTVDGSNNLCLLKTGQYWRYYLVCCGATMEDHPVATHADEWWRWVRKWAKKKAQ